MAWTTPRTWVAGELVTASMMNVHVRDNLNYLFSADLVPIRGSWTPTIIGSSSGASAAYATQVGRYFKIGNLVFVSYHVQNSTGATYVGSIQIGGLPYLAENVANMYVATSPVYFGQLAVAWASLVGYVAPNTQAITILGTKVASAGVTGLANADIGNNTQFIVSACYQN